MLKIFTVFLNLIATYRAFSEAAEIHITHFTPKTWNEARAICARDGGHLLEIVSEEDWNIWITLLNSTSHSKRPSSYVYWFGLHAIRNSTTGSPTYVWDPCESMNYSAPLVADLPFDYACVVMWVHREVSPGQYFNSWYKGRRCDLAYPFICTHKESDLPCVPQCSVTIATVDEITCNNWCQIRFCKPQFIHQTNRCYIHHTNTNETHYTMCILPDLTATPAYCTKPSEFSVTYSNFNDANVNVTHNVCPAETTTAHHSSTTSPSTTVDQTTSEGLLQDAPTTCLCSCQDLWKFDVDQDTEVVNLTLEEKVEIIVAELTVDKKNTSLSQRRYTSATDDRTSSVGIGVVAVGIIITIFCIVVMIDLARIWHEIRHVVHEIRLVFSGHKVGHTDRRSD